MKVTRVEIHIDHLVLEGVEPERRRQVVEELEAELGRLITHEGLPPSLMEAAQGATLAPSVQGQVGTTGVELARALYRGMGG